MNPREVQLSLAGQALSLIYTPSPEIIREKSGLVAELDVQAVLPTVRVPTLVVPHADDYYSPPALGKKIADQDLLEPKLSR